MPDKRRYPNTNLRCALFGKKFSDLQKHVTTKSQLEAQELENKNVKDVIKLEIVA